MKRTRHMIAGCLAALLLSLLPGGCTVQHSKIYDDDMAIAADDRVNVVSSIGQKLDDGAYEITVSSQSGAQTVWYYTADDKDEEVTLDCVLTVRSGSAKMVLISPDNTVLTMVEATEAGEEKEATWFFSSQKGTWRVKIVAADSADYTAALEFSHGTWGNG